MSHEIEQRADGQFSYVGAREPAWHLLGKTYEGVDGLTVATVLDDLDVGQVVSRAIAAKVKVNGINVNVSDPTKKMTIRLRDSGPVPLGVVGADYTIIQEVEAFQFLDNMVDSGEALISSAGLLRGGRRAFCTMRLPQGVMVGGVDAVDLYLFVVMGHDGRKAFTAATTPIRVVCQNTVDMALRGAGRIYRLVHSKNAELKVAQARRVLDLAYAYRDAWTATAEAMISKHVTDERFAKLVEGLFKPTGAEISKRAETAYEAKRDVLTQIWRTADTTANIRNTAWGAYQSVVEYVDWGLGTRGADDPNAQRFERTLHDTLAPASDTQQIKQRAYAVASQL